MRQRTRAPPSSATKEVAANPYTPILSRTGFVTGVILFIEARVQFKDGGRARHGFNRISDVATF